MKKYCCFLLIAFAIVSCDNDDDNRLSVDGSKLVGSWEKLRVQDNITIVDSYSFNNEGIIRFTSKGFDTANGTLLGFKVSYEGTFTALDGNLLLKINRNLVSESGELKPLEELITVPSREDQYSFHLQMDGKQLFLEYICKANELCAADNALQYNRVLIQLD